MVFEPGSLREIAEEIIHFKSLVTGVFPSDLKQRNVTLVHKSGSRDNLSSFWSITVDPVVAKMLEQTVTQLDLPITFIVMALDGLRDLYYQCSVDWPLHRHCLNIRIRPYSSAK